VTFRIKCGSLSIIVSPLMDDNSTLIKLLAVITISASHREHRIVLPHDLSSLINY